MDTLNTKVLDIMLGIMIRCDDGCRISFKNISYPVDGEFVKFPDSRIEYSRKTPVILDGIAVYVQ